MEGRGPKSISSGDKFTFPSTTLVQTQDSEFQFGSVTPAEYPNSPADYFFFNGRLLPHAFPVPTNTIGAVYSRSTSRASSVSSKDSLVSSRSNSTNSRSSSSARTSTSTEANSDQKRRSLSCQSNSNGRAAVGSRDKYTLLAQQYYGSSQRWQFISPVPVLNHQVSRRKRSAETSLAKEGLGRKKTGEGIPGARSGLDRRFFRSFVSACKECHAIKPATRDHVLQGNIELQGSM